MAEPFEHTRQALAEYDAGQRARDIAWGSVENANDVDACQDADEKAVELLQDAFFLDTAHMNTLDKCRMATVKFMRYCASGASGKTIRRY